MDARARFNAAQRGIPLYSEPVGLLSANEFWLVLTYRDMDTEGQIEAMDAISEIHARHKSSLHIVDGGTES